MCSTLRINSASHIRVMMDNTENKTFTVYRSKWCRGNMRSRLKTTENTYCCLGFLALQLWNAKEEDILEVSTLFALQFKNGAPNPGYSQETCPLETSSKLTDKIMDINDSHGFKDESHREIALKGLFAKAGITVNFED